MSLLRTFHHHLYTFHEAMDNTQGLGNSYPSLFLRQSIQSLNHALYLALPQQLSSELLCATFSDR
jgi:hypothetical protein